MSKPVVADNKPIGVSLQKGEEYHWCACGRSRHQPFCDGSHRGTDFTPLGFRADKSGEAWLCMCKHTGNPPPYGLRDPAIDEKRVLFICNVDRIAPFGKP